MNYSCSLIILLNYFNGVTIKLFYASFCLQVIKQEALLIFEILRVFSVSTFTFIKYKIWTTKGLNPQPASQVLVQVISVEARGPLIRYNLEINTYLLRYVMILTLISSKKVKFYQKPKSLVVWGRGDLTYIFFSKVVKYFKSGETCLVMSRMHIFYSSVICKQRLINYYYKKLNHKSYSKKRL